MPILPIIDLLILMGWTALMVGAALKAIAMTTRYNPAIASLSSLDFALIAAVCFGFALTLAARTWVKLNEPSLLAMRRRQVREEARRLARQLDGEAPEEEDEEPAMAGADRS